jgi:hypothetical protein
MASSPIRNRHTRAMRLIRTADEITPDALGRDGAAIASVERIGTGQMSQSHRVRFDDGSTVVVKLASENEQSRAAGTGMGAYFREISFYRNLANRLPEAVPHCLAAEYEPGEGWFTLVLEDVEDGVVGDQIAGCGVDEARAALRALAAIQAPVMNDLHLGAQDWLNQPNPLNSTLTQALLPGFLERYGDRVAPEHAEVCRRFAAVVDPWYADRRPPLSLAHGDYRLDNLLFTPGGGCRVVDWQTVSWGSAALDAAYFVGGGLSVADRRAHEESLVREYHAALEERGVEGLGFEELWDEYRRMTFHGILMTVCASMVVERTDRGDDMFMAQLERNAQQVLDLGALDLLPKDSGERPAPLVPDPEDEGTHPPGPEPLWNESWYFDAVSDDGSLALYVRLGRLPNQDVALYTACVCGPGRPSVMLVEGEAPLPPADDPGQAIASDGLSATQDCEAPLSRFRVRVRGTGEAHADEAAPLRAESGEPVALELDLVWATDGTPFRWRQATRYEIPCRVEGTVRVGEEEIVFAGPGQRDHSWGSRDWWATDWMWSALHLEDGTHTHMVGVPDLPGVGVGYVQRGGEVDEIAQVTATQTMRDDGLVAEARIESGPTDLGLEIEPVAFGALRLEAPDGRLTHFPRAFCRVRTAGGVGGVGWVEWNRVQKR